MADGNGVFLRPILSDPDQWMALPLGREVDLVCIELPTQELYTGAPQLILPPIVFFPGLQLEVGASMGVTIDFDFGLSSRGLITDGLTAIDGFFIVD